MRRRLFIALAALLIVTPFIFSVAGAVYLFGLDAKTDLRGPDAFRQAAFFVVVAAYAYWSGVGFMRLLRDYNARWR